MRAAAAPAWLLAGMLLAGCTPSLLDYESPVHVVRSGETLYTIAWQYGVDYRALARWNALANPDRIYPGQRLRIRPPAGSSPAQTASTRPASPAPASPATRTPEPPPRASSAGASGVRTSGAVTAAPPSWMWPTQGRVVAGFGSNDGIGSGIALAGTTGQPIYAAAAGSVVYIGTGLAGYGQLVIVKHSDAYLSAYGHTERVLVAQGDTVARGQQIASMGIGPRRQSRLHFEIRLNGVPIDPLRELPPRP